MTTLLSTVQLYLSSCKSPVFLKVRFINNGNFLLLLVITFGIEYKSCFGVFDLISVADWAKPNWRDYNSCFNTIRSSNQIDVIGHKDLDRIE
jgi:hypothetical protein